MARSKWIFGGQQSSASRDANPDVIPVNSSADAKKFGLENFGNTCYANSVIQALYFCAPFRELLIQSVDSSLEQISLEHLPVPKKPERKLSTSGSTDGPNGLRTVPPIPAAPKSLFSALRSLFVHIASQPANKGKVAPRAFIEKLKEVNDVFRSTMHQDAHEFLNYLLNRIVEEIEEDKKVIRNSTPPLDDLSNSITSLSRHTPTIVTAISSSNSGRSPQDATLVHKLFEGILTSETRCLTCETVSSRDESFLDLSIDIEQNASVTACLRQFSASEMLCQKNKFFCDSCCDLQEAEKRMKIKKLPNVLALHLKRFKFQEDLQKYIKLGYRVAFPFELRLFNTVDDTDDADRLFNLFGIVVHIGNGPHHGHYISIIKTQGSWQVFDDENVYPIAENDIPKYFGESNAGAAYVLYYQAADIDLGALGLRDLDSTEATQPALSHVPASSSQQSIPPPGLDEADSSDLSDPAYPITPLHSSPLLSSADKPIGSGLEDPTTPGPIYTSPLPKPPTPTSATRSKQGRFFGNIRRTPSTSARAQNASSDSTRPGPIETDPPPLPPNIPPSPITNGNNHREPDRKPSMWFSGKRKSLRAADKKSTSESNDPRSIPPLSASDISTNSQSLSLSNNWFRTTNQVKEKRRRPSEPAFFDTSGFATLAPQRPQSTIVEPLVLVDKNGYDTPPPASATSSVGSSTRYSLPPSSLPDGTIEFPPQRGSSLSESVKLPEHKKSLSSLPHDRKSTTPHSPRPATAPGIKHEHSIRPLPPVPPLPPSLSISAPEKVFIDESEAYASVSEQGRTRESIDDPSLSEVHQSNSVSSTSSATPLKRATRKLSMTGPILGLGFGKKDKKEKGEKETGKGPPSAFNQFARV